MLSRENCSSIFQSFHSFWSPVPRLSAIVCALDHTHQWKNARRGTGCQVDGGKPPGGFPLGVIPGLFCCRQGLPPPMEWAVGSASRTCGSLQFMQRSRDPLEARAFVTLQEVEGSLPPHWQCRSVTVKIRTCLRLFRTRL